MTNLSSIAHKLRALKALADEASGATEAERMAAAAKYAELLERTHMDASELELREEGTALVVVDLGLTGNAFLIGNLLGGKIGLFTQCKAWVGSKSGTVKFLGLKSDTEFAEWLCRSLVAFVQGEALAFTLDADPSQRLYANDVELFVGTCAKRIAERLKDLALQNAMNTDSANALVVVRPKMIEEHWASLGITLGRGRGIALRGQEHAAAAGRNAGDRASFARPVGGQGQTLRIGRA